MNRIILIAVFILITGVSADAQILKPVTWSYEAKRLNKNEVAVYLKATIDPGWHIYGTKQEDGGPVKTSFKFDKKDYKLIRTLKRGGLSILKSKMDDRSEIMV